MPEKLLVRSTNWIGDAAMSVAALREIKRQHPHLHIVVAGPAWVLGVFYGQDFIDSLIELPQAGNRFYRVWEERCRYEPILGTWKEEILCNPFVIISKS